MTKIEMGKQYRTRDGKEVRIYATDGGGCRDPQALIETTNEEK